MHISRARWARLLLLVSLLFGNLIVRPVVAQEPEIAVTSSTATTNFPDSIAFELSADIDATVTTVELIYQMAALETFQLLPADFTQDGTYIEATAEADLTIAFLPVGIDVAFRWVLTLDDDATVETDATTITWLDDRFDWNQISGEYVEVFGYDTSDDFLQLILDTAEEAARVLIDEYQPQTILPIRIWVYETAGDYAGTKAANSEEWSAGAAYPDLQVIHAVIPDGNDSEVDRIIPHEISHQILHMATVNPFNAQATWIDEGLAVIAQDGGEEFYEKLVERAYADDELLSMQGLISSFPIDPSEARLAYAQSFSMMTFILEEWGELGVTALIDAYSEVNSHDDVLIQALGMSLSDLEQLWLTWLGDKFALAAA